MRKPLEAIYCDREGCNKYRLEGMYNEQEFMETCCVCKNDFCEQHIVNIGIVRGLSVQSLDPKSNKKLKSKTRIHEFTMCVNCCEKIDPREMESVIVDGIRKIIEIEKDAHLLVRSDIIPKDSEKVE